MVINYMSSVFIDSLLEFCGHPQKHYTGDRFSTLPIFTCMIFSVFPDPVRNIIKTMGFGYFQDGLLYNFEMVFKTSETVIQVTYFRQSHDVCV